MTDGASTTTPPEGGVVLPRDGADAFSVLMGVLAPEDGDSTTGEGTATADAAAGDGAAAAEAGGDAGGEPPAGGEAGKPAAPATGGGDGVQAGGAAAGSGDAGADATGAAGAGDTAAGAGGDGAGGDAGGRPADWTRPAAELVTALPKLTEAFESRVQEGHKREAFEAVQTEHKAYFEAINKHPRLLVGKQVPAIEGEGMETLRSTEDAREWQDAVKSLLVEEVTDRASRAMEEQKDFLATIHSSIELFAANPDLIPGTKDFDVELANRLTEMLEPYELRVEEKLQGYTIPVQPIVKQLRAQITKERAAKSTAPAAASTPAAGAAKTAAAASSPAADAAKQADPPQAGVQSKAGNSSEKEDMSTFWGTLGLPDLRL